MTHFDGDDDDQTTTSNQPKDLPLPEGVAEKIGEGEPHPDVRPN